jgi:aminoglycoside 6'-N-acetyltransferase
VTTEIRRIEPGDVDAVVALLAEPGVREWWGETTADDVREDLGTAFVVLVGGDIGGYLQVDEKTEEEWRQVAFDIALADRFQGQGHGRAALRLAVRHFAARGHHRFTIDPAIDNERAIRSYAAVGFKPVGVLRKASKLSHEAEYGDDLLMDLLVEELTA